MATVPEAQALVEEWERENGHPAEHAWASISYRWELDPRLSREQVEDGANRWLDLEKARRDEQRQRWISEAERAELRSAQLMELAGDEPLPPGGEALILRYLAG